MGQAFSSGNNVFVYLDKPHYFPGDTVNGYVLLNCVNTFKASALVLQVEGYERTQWEERRDDNNYDSDKQEWITTTNTLPRSAEKDIFKLKVPLQTYAAQQQEVHPGQYQYPFSFVLPLGIPGSFEYKDNNTLYGGITYNMTNAKIKYKVEAKVETVGMLSHNIKHSAALTVYQRMPKLPSQLQATNKQTVRACCCINKGSCVLAAQVEKDSYYPAEVAYVLLQVDNQSTASFSAVLLQLVQEIRLTADGAGYREIVREVAEEKSQQGVTPGEVAQGAAARRLALHLPVGLVPSALGQLVQCDYHLLVTLKGHALTSDVKLKLPVAIYQAVTDYQAYSAPPPGWQPQVLAPPAQLQLPSAPPLPPMAQQMGSSSSQQGTYVPPQPM